MRSPALFYSAIVIAIIGIALGVYYLMGGIWHPILPAAHPKAVYSVHRFYAGAAFVVAVICIIGAVVARPRKA